MDEQTQLNGIQARLRGLVKPLWQLANKKWTKAPSVAELEKLHASIPTGASVGEVVDSAIGEFGALITEIRKSRGDAFGRLVSEFVVTATSGTSFLFLSPACCRRRSRAQNGFIA